MARLLYITCLLFLLASCHNDEAEDDSTPAPRTILIYMMGENSLASFMQYDIEEMKQAVAEGALQGCNLIVCQDGTRRPALFRIRQHKGRAVCDTICRYDALQSTDPDVLRSVIDETFQRFPAYSYGLVLWSHGDGWLPDDSRRKIATRWIGTDQGNSGPKLEIEELADVLAQYPKLDFLFFDACFMQTIEVAYALRHHAQYIIGSVTETPGIGAPYHRVLRHLCETECNIASFIDAYYGYYTNPQTIHGNFPDGWAYGCAISAIRCDAIDALAAKTKEIIAAADFANADFRNVQCYDMGNFNSNRDNKSYYYDFNGFIRAIAADSPYVEWKYLLETCTPESFRATTSSCYSAYIGSSFPIDTEQYCGISTYILQNDSHYANTNEAYKQLDWYKAVYPQH